MKIIVCGGDGFCGWPISLRLNAVGHDVTIIDNLSRRHIDVINETESLTPIKNIHQRVKGWAASGLAHGVFKYIHLDISKDYGRLVDIMHLEDPVCVVHLAEQRAAPYSMKNSTTRRYTVFNNIGGTHNLLNAMLTLPVTPHLVHIGSTGVYGYGSLGHVIGEGNMRVEIDGETKYIRHPTDPGSVYHMTKCMDAEMFYYYNKNYNMRITDLHQGIVWGTNTPETLAAPALINRFDYCGDYGTVLNRFLMQAAIGHPLTVYGTGGQTRAFIHITDTVRCVQLAVESSPNPAHGVRVFNQTTEQHTVRELAKMVSELTGAGIKFYKNPRVEAAENTLRLHNRGLIKLGLVPTFLNEGLMGEVCNVAHRYKYRCDVGRIICTSTWRRGMVVDLRGEHYNGE